MESIEQKLHRIEERIHSLELQGLVTSSPYLTESDFPSAGLDQIVVHNGTNQVIGYFPATSDGLDSAIGSAGSGDAIWLPACIIGDDHSVPAGVSLIGVGRYVSILTGQITLASGAALVSLSILRTGSSSATAVVVSAGSAYINSCKLSVVLTGGTAYLVSPYGNTYLSSCELVCTVNGANVTPFEGLRNLTYTFDSTLQGWAFSTTQVAYTTGAVGMTVNDASVLAWNSGKLRFTVPSFNTNWKYGSAVIDVSSRNFVITQDSVLSFTVAESYTGNSYYGALIEFTDGTSQAFSNMWTGGPIDDAHIGKTLKKIYIGYLVANMYTQRTIDFDNVVVTNVGGSTYVHACSGINAPGTYLDGDRAVFDALTAPSQHANDIDVAAGLHHTIGTTTGKAADGGVVNSHINNTSNPHGVTKGQVGLGNVANVLCNLAGTTAPTVNEDSGDGYSAGSLWIDTVNHRFYICVDPTLGAAIWRNYALTVQEIDGSPLVTNVKSIKFTNGSVTDNGDGTVTVNVGGAGGSITMQEQDGTPNISVSTLKVPNGTLTDEGGGVATFDPAAASGITTTADLYANRPSAGNNANLFLPTDGHNIQRDNGSAWASWGPIFPLTEPPAVSDFTWVNQGTATATKAKGLIYLSDITDSNVNRLLIKNAPSAPYTFTVAFTVASIGIQNETAGIVLQQSSDGKQVTFGLLLTTNSVLGITCTKWSAHSSWVGSYKDGKPNMSNGLYFLRFNDDGSTYRTFSFSKDGQNFLQFLKQSRTDYCTPNKIGFYVGMNGSGSGVGMSLLSWKTE